MDDNEDERSTGLAEPATGNGATSPGPAEPDLFEYLKSVLPSPENDESPAAYAGRLARLADKQERTALVAANAHRAGVALALLDAQPAGLDDRARGKWKATVATEMGYSKRHVQNFLTLGESIRKAEKKREIRFLADLLNRPMVKVAKAIDNVLAGQAPDAKPEKPDLSPEQRWHERISRIWHDPEGREALDATLRAWGLRVAPLDERTILGANGMVWQRFDHGWCGGDTSFSMSACRDGDTIRVECRRRPGVPVGQKPRVEESVRNLLDWHGSRIITKRTSPGSRKRLHVVLATCKEADQGAFVAALNRVFKAHPNPPPPPEEEAVPDPRVSAVLQYPGGKWFVAPMIAEVIGEIPDGVELREPYCGGASVAIHMLKTGKAKKVWLNDTDPAVQALWNAVIHEHDDLCDALRAISDSQAQYLALQREIRPRGGILSGVDLAAAKVYTHAVAHNARGDKSGYSPQRGLKWTSEGIERLCERIRETHGLLAGHVVHNKCTGRDALDVVRAPGTAIVFADPPYWRCGEWLYPRSYRRKEQFYALADALRESRNPWLLTIGDDEVSEQMKMPGATIHKIRSGVRWHTMELDGLPEDRPWLLDLKREQGNPKRELLISSGGYGWGFPAMDPVHWDEWFGDGEDQDQVVSSRY